MRGRFKFCGPRPGLDSARPDRDVPSVYRTSHGSARLYCLTAARPFLARLRRNKQALSRVTSPPCTCNGFMTVTLLWAPTLRSRATGHGRRSGRHRRRRRACIIPAHQSEP